MAKPKDRTKPHYPDDFIIPTTPTRLPSGRTPVPKQSTGSFTRDNPFYQPNLPPSRGGGFTTTTLPDTPEGLVGQYGKPKPKLKPSGGRQVDSSTGEERPEYKWWVGYQVDGAPSWWRGLVTDDPSPEAQYAMLINSMIPFMSPEDQRYMGDYLSRLLPATPFKDYQPETSEDVSRIPAPPQMDSQSNAYFSANRGRQMAETLEKMRQAAKLPEDKVGAGFRFLKSLAKDIETFGAREGEGITRSNLQKLFSSFDQKLAETQAGELQGFGELGRAVTNPFFSAGKLVNVFKDEQGNYRFGKQNPMWS